MRTNSVKIFKLSRLICIILMLLFAAKGLIAQNPVTSTNKLDLERLIIAH